MNEGRHGPGMHVNGAYDPIERPGSLLWFQVPFFVLLAVVTVGCFYWTTQELKSPAPLLLMFCGLAWLGFLCGGEG